MGQGLLLTTIKSVLLNCAVGGNPLTSRMKLFQTSKPLRLLKDKVSLEVRPMSGRTKFVPIDEVRTVQVNQHTRWHCGSLHFDHKSSTDEILGTPILAVALKYLLI
jgi:hypothetical protein